MKNIKKIAAVLLVLASCVGLTIAATRNAVDEHSDPHSLIHQHGDFDCGEHAHDFFVEENAHFDGDADIILVGNTAHQCPTCKGKKVCWNCKGKGKCPNCNGKGKVNNKKCPNCNGDKKCNICEGKKKCFRCGGTGKIIR